MKSIKTYVGLGVLMVLSFSSCKKEFLDLKPYTARPLAEAYKTEADLSTAVNGMYQTMRSTNLYGRTLPLKGDLMADNVFIKPANSGRYLDFNDYNIIVSNTNAVAVWGSAYLVIKNANAIINSTLAANANVNQFKGEAYAVRALMYFELVRNFAKPYTVDPNALGVPIITSFSEEALPGRNTSKEVYKLITDDLAQAFTLMTQNLNGTMTLAGTGTSRPLNSS